MLRRCAASLVVAGVLATCFGTIAAVVGAAPAGAAPPPVGTITGHAPYVGAAMTAPRGIVAGPDGAMWITAGSNTIVRVTSDGAASAFASPQIQGPRSITSGPDGALWFANSGGTVGRLTTAGVVSALFDLDLDFVANLAAGPDGAIWFTTPDPTSPGKVGRITTDGTITMFPDPSITRAVSITAGPDGAMWFAGKEGTVVRITPAGVLTHFDTKLPGEVSAPPVNGLTFGPGGALYFTASFGGFGDTYGRVGKMTLDGSVTATPETVRFNPTKIVTAPNGAMYFLDPPSLGNPNGPVRQLSETLAVSGSWTGGDDLAAAPDGSFWTVATATAAVRRNGATVAEWAERRGNAIARGPDGALWYLTMPRSIDRLAPDGTLTRYASPVDFTEETSLVLGPENKLWFAGNTTIHSLAMDGHITTTEVVPYTGNYGMDLTAGPEGRLWFAVRGPSPRIGRIDARGIVETFTAPGLVPRSIVAGRDGALWFTNNTSLGRITTDGTISYRHGVASSASTGDITVGPDGALWFVRETSPLSIARVETGPFSSYFGTVFPTTIPGAAVTDSAWGPDGRLWLTLSTGAIIRMATSGAYETFPLTSPVVPRHITPGPDGGMWFTQRGAPASGGDTFAVGRVEALGAVTTPSAPDVVATADDASLTTSWTVGDGGEPITSVTVTLSPGGATCTWTGGPQTCTFSGLTNGTTYGATARATNSIGTGPSNAGASATPHVRPPVPAFLTATNAGNGCVTVRWWPYPGALRVRIQPVGGAEVFDFDASTNERTVCLAYVPQTVVSFRIIMITALDSSPPVHTNTVVLGAPATPSQVSARAGVGRATVSWSNGPSPQPVTHSIITPYRNGVAQAPQTFAGSATSQTVTGLDDGVSYTFTVATRDGTYTSVASARSLPLMIGEPWAPAFPSAMAGAGSATVYWWPSGFPATGSIITPYRAGAAQTPIVFTDAKSAQVIGGLITGETYTFTIALTTASATGPASTTPPVVIG